MTGSENCVFIYFPVPQQSQHCSGWECIRCYGCSYLHTLQNSLWSCPKSGELWEPAVGAERGCFPCGRSAALSGVGFHVRVHICPSGHCLCFLGPGVMSLQEGHVCRSWWDVFSWREDSEEIFGGHIHAAVAPLQQVQPAPCFASGEWHARRGKSPWKF